MKPKTFRYNDIILFFENEKLPLSPAQKKIIAQKVREEFDLLQEYKERQKEKLNKKLLKRMKRKEARINQIV